ncbi:MAG TPA: sulfite reductase subunit alpha, partial [Opitutae bacterium]|nr:sulfite reductase subunit alpha [Opitutae bacterium]
RTRNDAVALVEKIREEVSEEEEAAAGPENAEQASAEETSEPVPEKETTPESEKES